jgi:hypothetical protein
LPLALYAAVFIVVIAVFKMPLGIASTARHGSYRQHGLTLTLFEIPLQGIPLADKNSIYWVPF